MYLILIWTMVLSVAELANGNRNPYEEALRARPWKSVQKYVEVRPGAHLFYWLYYADGSAAGADRKPLLIWIQGGPGFAASGLANFAEIGPLNMEMEPRNHTWVHGRNVLLLDHPVGAGFSYVTDESLLVKTDREVATDLSRAIKVFFRRHKEFRKTPTYIFGQSYGGKICARLGFYLHTAIEKKRLKMNFKGIGIGSGWVDPKESTLVQPEFLYNMGVIDQTTFIKAMNNAREMCKYVDKKDYVKASKINTALFEILNEEAGMEINFNNIIQPNPYPALARLEMKINRYVKPALAHAVNQSLRWRYMDERVWANLNDYFLVPANKFLEMLLNNTKLKIAVYNGNMDVVTPLAGASNWVHKLKWPGALEFKKTKRIPIRGINNGFYKKTKQLSFWWIFGSGHWVPEDNPAAMGHILDYMTSEHL